MMNLNTYLPWTSMSRPFSFLPAKPFKPRPQPTLVVFWAICLLLPLFLVPCHASAVYQLPLKRFRTAVYAQMPGQAEVNGQLRMVKRDTSAVEAAASMKDNLKGLSGDGYYIDVDIGTPPQRMQVLIDTGSANFAVAAEPDSMIDHYFARENSTSFEDSALQITVPYTEGKWTGTLGTDEVVISSMPNISTRTNIACITESSQFFIRDAKWQGILGLAYAELARPDSSLVPFWDSLTSQHPEVPNLFSIQLCGSSFIHSRDKPLLQGSLVLGAVLPSMSKSAILYAPLYKKWYYEVVVTDMLVAGKSLAMNCKEYNLDKTIVDSGTTNIRLPVSVFTATVAAIRESIQNSEEGSQMEFPGHDFYTGGDIMCYPDMSLPFSVFPVLSFFLQQSRNSSFRLDISPQHYLRPIEAPDGSALVSNQTCVTFGISKSAVGTVLGAVLMEAFYVVFDRDNSQVGFGQTTCPLPAPAHPLTAPAVQGPFSTTDDLNLCAYQKPGGEEKALLIISYVMVGLAVIVAIPLVLLLFLWIKNSLIKRRRYHGVEGSEARTVLSSSE